jgi:diguanylate cyclase (GGDEF)-like protein
VTSLLSPGPSSLDHWQQWVLGKAQVGLLMVDQKGLVAFCNDWFCRHASIAADQMLGKSLAEIFPGLKDSYLEKALSHALGTGLSSFLSNSLHSSPFPLYQPKGRRGADNLIKQSVHILAMGADDAAQAGQRFVLVQINDMTQATTRERLLKAQATTLHGIARIDSLTGIGNRRHFDETMKQEFRHAMRSNTPISLLLVDLDLFKLYNDTYGHVKGDEALTLTASALRSACHRSRDIAARYGGEEFALILPETDLKGACKVAAELQGRMQVLQISHPQNAPWGYITLSVGIATMPAAGLESPTALVELADTALYQAKHMGRNCICLHDGSTVGFSSDADN